jgi:hypothetical protein
MADNGSDDGTANNGFGWCSLHQWEGRLLYAAGYPVPPDFRAPGGWRLSAGGIPIPPPPMGAALDAAIDEVLEGMEDSSDDDLYQPTPPRFGDARQGSSRWTPGQSSQQAPPQDNVIDSSGDDDDGGDYTRFYRHFGM